jgi:hypothetical protein
MCGILSQVAPFGLWPKNKVGIELLVEFNTAKYVI